VVFFFSDVEITLILIFNASNKDKAGKDKMAFLEWMGLGWVGSSIGILGVASGFIFYFLSNKKISPCYQYKTTTIIGNAQNHYQNEVDILFRGKSVSELNRTVIAIWNDGKKYLDQSHMLDKSPLTLSFPDGEILNYQIKDKTSESIEIESKLEANGKLVVNFNYLDHREGFSMEILHTSTEKKPVVSCIIKGVKKGFENKGRVLDFSDPDINTGSLNILKGKAIPIVILIAGILFLCIGLFYGHVDSMIKSNKSDIFTSLNYAINKRDGKISLEKLTSIISLSTGLIYVVLAALIFTIKRRKAPKSINLF